MEEVKIFVNSYDKLCDAIIKSRRKSHITDSIELCIKALNNLLEVYPILSDEYHYMAYNTLLMGKLLHKEAVSILNSKRHNEALEKLDEVLKKFENIPNLTQNNNFTR